MDHFVDELDRALRAVGDADRARGAQAYLKSDLEFIGVAAGPLRQIAREFLSRHLEVDRTVLLGLVRQLWRQPVYELKAVAVALLEGRARELEFGDLEILEELIRESHTWALVDWICTKIVSPIVDRHPEAARPVLRRWAGDEDFWIRRSSLLSQLPGLRAGGGDFSLFAEFAETMLDEREFFIRKAIGWVLRDVSKKRPELTFDFLDRNLNRMSGLSFREGSRCLPDDQQVVLKGRRTG